VINILSINTDLFVLYSDAKLKEAQNDGWWDYDNTRDFQRRRELRLVCNKIDNEILRRTVSINVA